MAGCDRWQQLGLGSVNGGSSGYTWADGKLWQDRFVLSNSVLELMMTKSQVGGGATTNLSSSIRDVALGGDHTLVLASNQRDVYAFGKGGDGQLGLVGKPYVMAPIKSKTLSEDDNNKNGGGVLLSAICAIQNCSITLDTQGSVRKQAGKCRSTVVDQGIQDCIARARQAGLIARAD
jgi:alpha-tubulin suppressor-like RCC1 family protein